MPGVYEIEQFEIRVRFPDGGPTPEERATLESRWFRWDPNTDAWSAPNSSPFILDAALSVAVPATAPATPEAASEAPEAPETAPAPEPVPEAPAAATAPQDAPEAPVEAPAAPAPEAVRPRRPGPDEHQMVAVENTDGPMLVVAGPGSGKTYTMVKRIAHLVLERGVDPENIMVVTYTRKAAKELLTRISNEFAGAERPVNVDRMRIGTFHSLCQQILDDYADRTGLKSFSVMEDFQIKFMMMNDPDFDRLFDNQVFPISYKGDRSQWGWKHAASFIECATTMAEEQVAPEALASIDEGKWRTVADYVGTYRAKLAARGRLDYADIMARTMALLKGNPDVLAELQSQITHVIVDEYQDTNFIQEQLVLMLAAPQWNVCVVGDDDQSLYRFRGATVQNILQFEDTVDAACEGTGLSCRRVDLVTNYRSQKGIVGFCKDWMTRAPYFDGDPTWGGCRHDKAIVPNPAFDKAAVNRVSVARMSGADEAAWHESTLRLVRDLQKSPEFSDLNQVAFLCKSVRSPKIRSLISYLEDNGVRVNAPRAGMFFKRAEVRSAVGCMMRCFPSCDGIDRQGAEDVSAAVAAAASLVATDSALASWIAEKRAEHAEGLRDGAVTGTFFEMMRFQPFAGWLDRSDTLAVADAAPARNLAALANVCASFENGDGFQLAGDGGADAARVFFGRYLADVMDNGDLEEYEDAREYAPAGSVSFMTIHQAKGMEFPVVVVCLVDDSPWGGERGVVDAIRSLNPERRESPEQYRDRANFDFWRKYYTAFSRAQDLLVLSSIGDPAKHFAGVCQGLPNVAWIDYEKLHLREVKPANIMESYSFTKDVAAYQACPRRYKLYRELSFPPTSRQDLLFGTTVHQCVEDIHRVVKRTIAAGGDPASLEFGRARVMPIVRANIAAAEREEGERAKFPESQVYEQVMKYVEHSGSIWRDVVEPEAAISEVRDGYLLEGAIDLIHGGEGAVEVVDFKTGEMPKNRPALMAKYEQQLLVYAHLVRERLGREVSGAKLYFTGDTGDDPVVEVAVDESKVAGVLAEFDETVAKIEAREFSGLADDERECRKCAFSGYCGRERK